MLNHQQCTFAFLSTINMIQTATLTTQSPLPSYHMKLQEKPCISLKPQGTASKKNFVLNELDSIKVVRRRNLSHWPHNIPNSQSMANAGWFSCNTGDRTICIYCNTICHQWMINDDPAEVHARLAPQCPFVLSMSPVQSAPVVVKETSLREKLQPAHQKMALIPRRQETFSSPAWTTTSPSADDLVRAGFFFSGVANTVTCFYCNGSLHKWGPNDNPMIEHARWFPHCAYARDLCGHQLYSKIQMSKRRLATQQKIDKDELLRSVSARLDLPVVGRLRSQYQLAVIKRCLEDQLKMKNDDFVSDLDWSMACQILQKQIDIIKGCPENVIIPSDNQQKDSSTESPKQSFGECLICLTEEKQVACMPCGHLCACVPCGYSLTTCPMCRENIHSFMRVSC